LLNGGSSLTRLDGKAGSLAAAKCLASNLLKITYLLTIPLTLSRPRRTQYFLPTQFKVSLIPPWCTNSWASRMINLVNSCFGGKRIGCFASSGIVEWPIRPSQRIILSPSTNKPSCLTRECIQPLWIHSISSAKSVDWILRIHNFSDYFNSSAFTSAEIVHSCSLVFFMNRITNAVTRSNLVFVLYLWGSRILSIWTEPFNDIPDKECTIGCGFFITSL
jgi:hypothetical protein